MYTHDFPRGDDCGVLVTDPPVPMRDRRARLPARLLTVIPPALIREPEKRYIDIWTALVPCGALRRPAFCSGEGFVPLAECDSKGARVINTALPGRRGHNHRPVRAELGRMDWGLVTMDREYFRSRTRIPKANSPVRGSSNNPSAVRAESDGAYRGGMPDEIED